jgi:hypothetical protein
MDLYKKNIFVESYYSIKRKLANPIYYIREFLKIPHETDFRYVDLIFENCDYVRVPSKLVEYLEAKNINKDVWTNYAHQYVENFHCTEFSISIKNEALELDTWFKYSMPNSSTTFLNYIKNKDVCCVSIKPNNKKAKEIQVPYDGTWEETNTCMEYKFGEKSFEIKCKNGIT